MADEFQEQLEAARRRKEAQRREADAEPPGIEQAREEAMALAPQVRAAVAALRRAQAASVERLESSRDLSDGNVVLCWERGRRKTRRPTGWAISVLHVLFEGEPWISGASSRVQRMSIEDYARGGLYWAYSYDREAGSERYVHSAPHHFRFIIKAIAEHLINIGQLAE